MGSFRQVTSHHRKKGAAVKMTWPPSSLPPPPPINVDVGETGKAKKRSVGARLWTRFDWSGAMEVVNCDKTTIITRTSVTASDLRTAFSNSSKILAREKAIVVNLEVIKAIVTAEEVLMLDPLCLEALSLTNRLKQQFPQKNGQQNVQSSPDPEGEERLESELPFEFQVLEMALQVVCSCVDSNVVALEIQAWPLLDELIKKVSTKNLKNLRVLKSNLTCLLARVQKVRDEIEHFLDDKENMADLYLNRKWIKNQQTEAIRGKIESSTSDLLQLTSNRSSSMVTEEDDVEDLEMLLEAYFMQLEGMRNKILMMKEHIDNTEENVKILQNSRRNGLMKLKMVIETASFAITGGALVVNLFGMNIPIPLYNTPGAFVYAVLGAVALCFVLFFATLGIAKSKQLFD